MTQDEVSAMRNRARAARTYYPTCPASLPNAQLIFIETGDCAYTSNTQYNSLQSPGMLVINDGTLTLGGTSIFYGLIYMPNIDDSPGNVVQLTGDTEVIGAIVVDGRGGLNAGSSKVNLVYDANVFNLVTTTRSINVIANSWRELNGG
jgi:hypothetical protein